MRFGRLLHGIIVSRALTQTTDGERHFELGEAIERNLEILQTTLQLKTSGRNLNDDDFVLRHMYHPLYSQYAREAEQRRKEAQPTNKLKRKLQALTHALSERDLPMLELQQHGLTSAENNTWIFLARFMKTTLLSDVNVHQQAQQFIHDTNDRHRLFSQTPQCETIEECIVALKAMQKELRISTSGRGSTEKMVARARRRLSDWSHHAPRHHQGSLGAPVFCVDSARLCTELEHPSQSCVALTSKQSTRRESKVYRRNIFRNAMELPSMTTTRAPPVSISPQHQTMFASLLYKFKRRADAAHVEDIDLKELERRREWLRGKSRISYPEWKVLCSKSQSPKLLQTV